jgi:hypothetical protein
LLTIGVAVLALPSGAVAGGRARSYNARVLRVSSLGVVLRRAGGRTVRFSADELTQVASRVDASSDGHEPLAHMTGQLPGLVSALERLAPGVIVRVTDRAQSGGRPRVALGLPPAVGRAQRARGVVGSVFGGSFLLDTVNGLELRLRGHAVGLHACDQATVAYHQDHVTLVADSVRDTGRTTCAR